MAYIDKNTGLIVPGNAPGGGGGDTDLSFITAGAEHILEGKVGSDTNGKPVYGSLVPASGSSMDFYRCAAVYGPRDVDVFVVSGCPTAAANGNYMPTEYTTEDWEGTKYPVYSNGTYYYCYDANNWMNWGICTDYTTMSFIYSGSGTSWSDTDWNPVEGMSSVESKVTVDTDVPKTWDGYKAVAGSDGYTLETVLTTGLTYGNGYKPIIGKIYSADASAAPALKFAIPDGAKVYASFAKNSATAETGQSITYGAIAKCTFDTVEGIPCMMVSGTYVAVNENCNLANYSMSVWHQRSSSSSHLLDVGTIENNNNMTVTLQDGSVIICAAGSGAGKVQGSIQNARTPTWVHIVITRSGTSVRYYVDGNLKLSGELNNTLIDDGLIVVCGFKHSSKIYDNSGSFAGFRFYERVLTDDEIFALANEFAPTA